MKIKSMATVVALLIVLPLVVGCYGAACQLRIHNGSGQGWLIKINKPQTDETYDFVDRVEAGADGLTHGWDGGPVREIDVLDQDCQKVGTLRTLDGINYTVDEIPGLTGIVQRFSALGDGPQPGVTATPECGGMIFA
jgi:hypothetical protein